MAKRRGCARQSPNTEARRFRDDTRRGGMPSVYRRTTEVAIKPLSQVDETFARDEGEGDRTRDWWIDAHRRYFARQAGREGFEIDDEILTVFERFEVVWPLDVGGQGSDSPHQVPRHCWPSAAR
jgi:hypothetical protein